MGGRTVFSFRFLVQVVAAACAAVVALTLLGAEPAAAGDEDAAIGEYRRPGLDISGVGAECTFESPPRVHVQTFVQNVTPDDEKVFLDYEVSAFGRPDIEPASGVLFGEVRTDLFYAGGPLTVVLKTGGRTISTAMVDFECPGAGGSPLAEVLKECRESQLFYDVSISNFGGELLDPETVDLTIGSESFIIALDPSSSTVVVQREQLAQPGDRVTLRNGGEVLLDAEDVPVTCQQQPLDIDIEIQVQCQFDRAVVVTVDHRRPEFTKLELHIPALNTSSFLSAIGPGEVVYEEIATGVPNGEYQLVTLRTDVPVYADPIPIDEQSFTVKCVEDVATASIDSYCLDGNGVIAATVTGGIEGSAVSLSVSGLPDKKATVAEGEVTTLRRTGRRDGVYGVVVRDGDTEVARETVEVDCDPTVLNVALSVDCRNSRIVVELMNPSDTAVEYSVDILEAEVGPLVGTLDPGETVTRVRTGRSDGEHTVETSADGQVISTETVVVACVTEPSAEVFHYCFGGNGVIAARLTGAGPRPTIFNFAVTGLSDRVVFVDPGQTKVTLRTGRPDGVYDVEILGGAVVRTQITIACDE